MQVAARSFSNLICLTFPSTFGKLSRISREN